MTTIIKITHANEIRRMSTSESARGCTFNSFTATVKTLFPKLAGQPIALIWRDEEGDEIIVSSEIEFQESLRYMTSNGALLRFEARTAYTEAPSAVPASTAVHVHVSCDECGVNPIKGIRYKCTVRNDFDLCSTCEAKKQQPYPVIKIFDPAHHPAALFNAFHDAAAAAPGLAFNGRRCGGGAESAAEGGHWRRGGRPAWGADGMASRCPAMNPQEGGPAAAAGGCHGRGRARWGRHFGNHLGGLGKSLQETMAPFVEAFDQAMSGLDLDQQPASSADSNQEKKTEEKPAEVKQEEQTVSLEEQMLSAALEESMSMTSSTTSTAVSSEPLSTASAAAVEADWDVVRSGSPSLPVAPAAVVVAAAEPVPAAAVSAATVVDEEPAPVVPSAPAAAPVNPLQLLWRRELELLADMGFGDVDAALPLLQRHLVTPLALSGDRSAAPSVEGMQRVVSNLLGF